MRIRPRPYRSVERPETGAAAVEFALVVPILLLVLIGIINFGFVMSQQLSLSNAARQAARFAVTAGPDCVAIEAEARDAVATIGMDAAEPVFDMNGSCPRPCEGTAAGTNVTVTMTHLSEFVIPFPIPLMDQQVELEGRGQFRCEFS